jgi:hypothetical protein
MIEDTQALISDFEAALGVPLATPICHESQFAPHRGHQLPEGTCAVYVFSLSKNYGDRVPAGGNRILKVGEADCNSKTRFLSQEYSPSVAASDLATLLLDTKLFWPCLGITKMSEASVRGWIQENTDRDNFYLSASDASWLGRLEIYLRWRLRPLFKSG